MKLTIKICLLTVLSASLLLSGCNILKADKKTEESNTTSELAVHSDAEESDAASENAQSSALDDTSTADASSEAAESSSGSDNSQEPSDEASEASNWEEVSQSDGYCFDDEQIVEDYHHATVFTDDEAFNALFADNSLDTAYRQEQMEAETLTDMRQITIKYAEKWKDEVDAAYQKLHTLLEERPDEQQKLETSQQKWVSSLEATEDSFKKETESEGTQGLLAADSAIMNYYKGRAAILYQQIYVLKGTFEMS